VQSATQDAKASYANMRTGSTPRAAIVLSIANGARQTWLWEKKWAQLVAHHRRHQRQVGRPGEMPDGSCCSNGMLAIVDQQVGCNRMPDPDTGTIQTCWKWETAA